MNDKGGSMTKSEGSMEDMLRALHQKWNGKDALLKTTGQCAYYSSAYYTAKEALRLLVAWIKAQKARNDS